MNNNISNRYSDGIEKGNKVFYIDMKPGKLISGKVVTFKVALYGIWDGEKVQFDDDNKTLIRDISLLQKAVRTLKKSTIKELKEHYSTLITHHEQRFISYKKLLAELYKERDLYDIESSRVHFKEMKNIEEKFWKALVTEWTEVKQNYGI